MRPNYSHRKRVVRARTINCARLPKGILQQGREEYPDVENWKPLKRSDCVHGARPCPYVSCKYNLYLDLVPPLSIKLNFPDLEVHEMRESCVLDVANDGGITLEQLAELMNITRERARQIEEAALLKILRQPIVRLLQEHFETGADS